MLPFHCGCGIRLTIKEMYVNWKSRLELQFFFSTYMSVLNLPVSLVGMRWLSGDSSLSCFVLADVCSIRIGRLARQQDPNYTPPPPRGFSLLPITSHPSSFFTGFLSCYPFHSSIRSNPHSNLVLSSFLGFPTSIIEP